MSGAARFPITTKASGKPAKGSKGKKKVDGAQRSDSGNHIELASPGKSVFASPATKAVFDAYQEAMEAITYGTVDRSLTDPAIAETEQIIEDSRKGPLPLSTAVTKSVNRAIVINKTSPERAGALVGAMGLHVDSLSEDKDERTAMHGVLARTFSQLTPQKGSVLTPTPKKRQTDNSPETTSGETQRTLFSPGSSQDDEDLFESPVGSAAVGRQSFNPHVSSVIKQPRESPVDKAEFEKARVGLQKTVQENQSSDASPVTGRRSPSQSSGARARSPSTSPEVGGFSQSDEGSDDASDSDDDATAAIAAAAVQNIPLQQMAVRSRTGTLGQVPPPPHTAENVTKLTANLEDNPLVAGLVQRGLLKTEDVLITPYVEAMEKKLREQQTTKEVQGRDPRYRSTRAAYRPPVNVVTTGTPGVYRYQRPRFARPALGTS